MLRPFLPIVAVWAMLAAPVLCTAGLLAHSCGCDDGRAEVCDHEAECDADPCSEQILRKDESQDAFAADAGPRVSAAYAASPCDAAPAHRRNLVPIASHRPTQPLGVLHASDLPLLS